MHITGNNDTMELVGVKPPAVAGSFYPGDEATLRSTVKGLLERAAACDLAAPKALIAPHAGYMYSGPVAASVYARLHPARTRIERVVVLGPSHHIPFEGVAVSSAGVFETPLGRIPVDTEWVNRALELPFVHCIDAAFAPEHSLEVHLPFLQQVLESFRLVPLVVGDADPNQIGRLIDHLWGGDETCIVVSSDLSHYLDYETAQRRDVATAAAIEALRFEDIGYDDACGRNGVRGLLQVARARGLEVETVDLRNSGDTAGGRDRVVGYGAWALAEPHTAVLAYADRRTLLGIAANSIRHGIETDRALEVDAGEFSEALRAHGASFVTLHLDGKLRGCIGSLNAYRELVRDVAENAYAAALRDPRFAPLSAAEFDRVRICISVLSASSPLRFGSEAELLSQLRPGVDGLILEADGRRGTFLPAVWESLPTPAEFFNQLKVKAGLPGDYWSPQMKVSRYTTETFS